MKHNLKRPLFLKWCKDVNRDYDTHRTELGFLTEKGKLVVSNNHACHAGLNHSQGWCFIHNEDSILGIGPDDEDEYEDAYEKLSVDDYSFKRDPIVAIYSGIVNRETPEPEFLMFADWLIHRSPWASCFLNPTAEDVIGNCWVLDSEQPRNYVAGACFATRWPTEWPDRTKAWVAAVRAGVDETEAFFFSHGLKAHGDWDDVFPITIDKSSAWHIPLKKNINKKYFNNFINNRGVKEASFKEEMGYYQVDNTWGSPNYDLEYGNFTSIKPRGEEKQIKEGVNLNIFWKPKKVKVDKGYKFTSPIQLKNLVEDMKEIVNAT